MSKKDNDVCIDDVVSALAAWFLADQKSNADSDYSSTKETERLISVCKLWLKGKSNAKADAMITKQESAKWRDELLRRIKVYGDSAMETMTPEDLDLIGTSESNAVKLAREEHYKTHPTYPPGYVYVDCGD